VATSGRISAEDLKLVGQIMAVVLTHRSVLQASLRDHVPDADRRRVATLVTWLEKAGRIRRVRSGKSYELTPL
jgi:hypothetical protein